MAVTHRLFNDQGRNILCQMVTKMCSIRYFDGTNTGDFSGCLSYSCAVFARNQQIDVTTNLLCRGHRVQSCYVNFIIVVLDDYQITHD